MASENLVKLSISISGIGSTMNWPVVEIAKVPSGSVLVPIHINDKGIKYDGCIMVGQFAFDGEGTSRSDWCVIIYGLHDDNTPGLTNNFPNGLPKCCFTIYTVH